MDDALFNDRAVEVIRTEAKRNLGQSRRQRDPVSLDVRESYRASGARPRSSSESSIPVVVGRCANTVFSGMKRQRDETLESARLILQFAQPDADDPRALRRFRCARIASCIRTNTHLVHDPRHLQPSLPGNLVSGNETAGRAPQKISAPPPGQLPIPPRASFRSPIRGLPVILAKKSDLDHRERLQVHGRKALAQTFEQFGVIAERELRVKPADDVEFGHRFRIFLLRKLEIPD